MALTALGCSTGPAHEGGPDLADRNTCPRSPDLVPRCGVWWGYSAVDTSPAAMADVQALLGRPFDLVYRFHDLDGLVPTADERALVEDGTILHITLVPRDFSDPSGALIPWSAIASGQYDALLRQQAAGIGSLGAPVFVTFDHEADQPRKSAAGTPADFRRAWRHVHEVFVQAGATNAVWVWVVLGWEETFERAGELWPGNDVVDWISWDIYNDVGCRSGVLNPSLRQTFAEGVRGFYDWLHDHGPQYGIDDDLPMMISEAGSTLQGGATSAAWYASIPSVLRSYPQIKAVTLWSAVGNGICDFRFTDDPQITAGVRSAGLTPWLVAGSGIPTPSTASVREAVS